jgi:hypothetical protein
MAITTRDQLIDALGNNTSRIIINKTSSNSNTAGAFRSYWREPGQPAAGAIPTAVATCNNATLGGVNFTQQTSPATSYLGLFECASTVGGQTVEIHDRLAHMGGLSGTVTTAQTVGLDLAALLATDNIAARIGDSNYSDVLWWLEWYTATGTTAVTATVNVTFNDGTSNNLSAVSLAASRPAGLMVNLNTFVQAADAGKFIRDVNSVTLSATTGTAGNFGVTATRYRAASFAPLANARYTQDWAQLGLPSIPNAACLFPILLPSATGSTGLLGTGKIVHG